MTLFNGVTFRHPVLRINNRDQNVDFYQRLGFKLVNEENAQSPFFQQNNEMHVLLLKNHQHHGLVLLKAIKKLIKLLLKFLKLMKSKQF